jgi:membrane protein required for colicin V production
VTLFDYAVLGTLAISMLLGFWRGVVSELIGVAAWILAIILAKAWAPELSKEFVRWLADPALQYVAAFAAIAGAVLLFAAVVRLMVRGLVRAIGLGVIDRFLGMVFGVFRGVLLVVAGVLVGGLTMAPKQDWWRDAMLAPPLETAVVACKPWLPREWAGKIRYR